MFLFGNAFGLNTSGLGPAFIVISAFLAIVATILIFVFIVPEKKKDRLNKFGKFLHKTFNFKYLIVEKILQCFYILSTVFVIIYGFLSLFNFQSVRYYDYDSNDYYSSSPRWYGAYGLVLMILGPIVIRLFYELLMMAILLVKNVISINNKLRNSDDKPSDADLFKAPDLRDIMPSNIMPNGPVAQNTVKVCPNCGAEVTSGAFCPKCGTPV